MNSEFVRLLESLANGVVIADSTGTIIFTNHFLERMFGYEPGQLVGQSVESLLPAELRSLHADHRKQYNASPETRLMGAGRDLQARRKDGSVFAVEIGLSPIATPQGLQVVAVVTDITKRKRAEQRSILQRDIALILSQASSIESVALNLIEAMAVSLGWRVGALWLVDTETQVLRNTAFWQGSGVAAPDLEAASRLASFPKGESLLGHVWETGKPQWVPDLQGLKTFQLADEARTNGLRTVFELPIFVGTQTLGVLEFFSKEIRPPDEDLMELAVAVASQIGQFVERKRSERALGIFEERYRSLFENAVFGIIRCTASGKILDANPALVSMLNYDSADEVLRLNCYQHIYKNSHDCQQFVQESRTADRFDGFEAEWKTKTGGTVQVRLSGRTIRSDNRDIVGFEAIVEDITQRKLLEQQYRQAQKMEAIGRLAGGVAHDFNNLLTIIAVSTDTLMDPEVNIESLRHIGDEIARATEQGASLVRQLMAFSRTQPYTPEPVDVNAIIKSNQRMLRILAGEDIQFEFNLHNTDCLVAVESSRVEQILMNLVANSRDAMPAGGMIIIRTGVMDISPDKAGLYVGLKPRKYVMLRVADTGQGISSEIQPHIFEPFFTTKSEGRGTGLGLSTVYGIVRQHEGYIGCKSTVGEGTVFTIFLPAANHVAVSPPEPVESRPRKGTENILLVEDEPALRASVKRILEQNGYAVVVAPNAFEALKASENQQNVFDLLLTDVALPQMRGTELAKRLHQRHKQLRVLYMSGYSGEKVPSDERHFLPKPFRRDALVRKIREVLES